MQAKKDQKHMTNHELTRRAVLAQEKRKKDDSEAGEARWNNCCTVEPWFRATHDFTRYLISCSLPTVRLSLFGFDDSFEVAVPALDNDIDYRCIIYCIQMT